MLNTACSPVGCTCLHQKKKKRYHTTVISDNGRSPLVCDLSVASSVDSCMTPVCRTALAGLCSVRSACNSHRRPEH